MQDRPSTPVLIGAALQQATALVSAEAELIRLETTEKLTSALSAIASLVVASIFVMVAMIFLLQGLVEALVAHGWQAFAASFAVGGGIAFAALLTVLVAMRHLRRVRLKPERVVREIKATRDLAKGNP